MQLRSDGDRFHLELTETELNAIHSGLAETLEALEDWEFQTRTGLERHEMKEILSNLRDARRTLTRGGQSSE